MRQIRPYGCDEIFPGSDFDSDELELLQAVERYKRRWNRRFVSVREVLEIVKSLGYHKEPVRDTAKASPKSCS